MLMMEAEEQPLDFSIKNIKYTRPFKAYPRTEITFPIDLYGLPMQLATASDQKYLQFREQMLRQKRSQQESRKKPIGSTGSNPSLSPQLPPMPPMQMTQDTVKAVMSMSGGSLSMSGGSLSMSMSHLSDDNDMSQMSNGGTSSGGEERSTTPGTMHSLSQSGGHGTRKRGRPLPEDLKDEAYWERRRKNNEAAKRSRDARRAKEDEIAIRAAFLEQENLKLRVEVAALKSETAKLRMMFNN